MFRRNRLSPDVYIYFFRLGLLFPCFVRREGRVRGRHDLYPRSPSIKIRGFASDESLAEKKFITNETEGDYLGGYIVRAKNEKLSSAGRVKNTFDRTAISSRHYFPFDRNSIPPIIP